MSDWPNVQGAWVAPVEKPMPDLPPGYWWDDRGDWKCAAASSGHRYTYGTVIRRECGGWIAKLHDSGGMPIRTHIDLTAAAAWEGVTS